MTHTVPETYLSIIIPCIDEVQRLAIGMERLHKEYLDKCLHTYEIILVDNGSTDRTVELMQTLSQLYPYTRWMSVGQRGKGLAVRAGMLAAGGKWRMMADCDWSMPPREIPDLLPQPRDPQVDLYIGSRQEIGARRIGEPLHRHLAGRVFNVCVRSITGLPVQDTQCGFKTFSARAAVDIFSRAQQDGIAFDVEALYLAMLAGYSFMEVGITWVFDADSRVSLWRDSVQMFRDVLAIQQAVLDMEPRPGEVVRV